MRMIARRCFYTPCFQRSFQSQQEHRSSRRVWNRYASTACACTSKKYIQSNDQVLWHKFFLMSLVPQVIDRLVKMFILEIRNVHSLTLLFGHCDRSLGIKLEVCNSRLLLFCNQFKFLITCITLVHSISTVNVDKNMGSASMASVYKSFWLCCSKTAANQ